MAATPDPRAERMRSDPQAYFREARERALLEAKAADQRERELAKRKRD